MSLRSGLGFNCNFVIVLRVVFRTGLWSIFGSWERRSWLHVVEGQKSSGPAGRRSFSRDLFLTSILAWETAPVDASDEAFGAA